MLLPQEFLDSSRVSLKDFLDPTEGVEAMVEIDTAMVRATTTSINKLAKPFTNNIALTSTNKNVNTFTKP